MNKLVLLANLRKEYQKWKKEHPNLEKEGLINQFLILKSALGSAFKPLPCELDKDAERFQHVAKHGEPYAPVRPSGEKIGPRIYLSEIEPYLKDFIIASPVSWLVGGVCEHQDDGTEGDIDFLHMVPSTEELSRIVDFRIYRMLPEELAKRMHCLWEDRGARSPFTSCLPLYRLKFERIPGQEIIPMAEPECFSHLHLRTKHSKKEYLEAEKAARLNEITFGEFFIPQKPCRGYVPGQRQTLDFFLSLWKPEQFPVYSSKKCDGMNVEYHISKDGKSICYSEDGSILTDRLKLTMEEAQHLAHGHDVILLAETEWWEHGQHFPREVAGAHVKGRKIPDETGIVANVYDIVYFDEDIHMKPFEQRWHLARSLRFPQVSEHPDPKYKWNLIPNIKCLTVQSLRRETERLRKVKGSEGNVAKQASAPYDLTASRPMSWIKFHNSFLLTAIFIDAVETKTPGTYNLDWGILPGKRKVKEKLLRKVNGRDYAWGGKTFAVRQEEMGERGSHFKVEGETFNLTYDMRSKTFEFSVWAPRFMGLTSDPVDTIEEIEEMAMKAHCYQPKLIDSKGRKHYLAGKSGEELSSMEIK